MRIAVTLIYLLLWLTPMASQGAAYAEIFRVPAPQVGLNHADYEIKLLEIALKHASDHKDEHKIVYVEDYRGQPSNQGRKMRQFVDGNSPYDVIFSGYSPEREKLLTMIYIPLTRGLLGHRLLFIDRATDKHLQKIDTLDALKNTLTIGMPISHPEQPIYDAAGFTVVTAPGGTLWDLLARGRFDALLYGADESAILLEQFGGRRGDAFIVVSNQVRISYPYDSFFFVAKEDARRAAIIEDGLKKAYASGAFMTHFENFPPIKEGLMLINSANQRAFSIDNPLVSDEFRAIPAHYWHQLSAGDPDPQSGAPDGQP